MIPGPVKRGDILPADRKDRRLDAVVIERHGRELGFEPIDPGVTHRRAKPRELPGSRRKRRAAQSSRVRFAARPAS